MRISWATEPGSPARPNEDFVAAAPGAVVVLDGCSLPLGTDLGCAHGTAWFSRSLGTRLLARLTDGHGPAARPPVGPPEGAHRPASRPLVGRLAGAIADVAAAHRGDCDLNHPQTPAATVVALRVRGDALDYLVLGDSTLLLHTAGRLDAVTEPPGRITPYAAADPAVAERAITGTVPLREVRRAILMTDGASRPADRFHTLDWRELLRLVETYGPMALIERTRETEYADPDGVRWPRGKRHDDATVAYCDFSGAGSGT
ncbi:protein phosphatase 2C domain-containing protein [Actinomadura craniellae]|uniref:protein phosphatase 2C domain-containing protein n=1 Tax=Actinomadura craniellae TaxID=2231787 RepID=UPI001F3384D5|nr:protein phosphatase 2C domain-containing protein [Actinomadura craniellae]